MTAGDGLKLDDQFSGVQSPFERAVVVAGLWCFMVVILPSAGDTILAFGGDLVGAWQYYGSDNFISLQVYGRLTY